MPFSQYQNDAWENMIGGWYLKDADKSTNEERKEG